MYIPMSAISETTLFRFTWQIKLFLHPSIASVFLTWSVLIGGVLVLPDSDKGICFSGCPSSCECKEFGEGQRKKILVTGEELLSVPSNLPYNTGAVYVKKITTHDLIP